MRVSTRGDYGIRALIELAANYGQGPIQASEIALRRHIPERYLDQLMTTLRKAGFVRSVRGPSGGHELARDPGEISVLEVITALEGSVSPVAWLDDPAEKTEHPHQCGQREIWERLRDVTITVLSDYSIADMESREPHATAGSYRI